MPQHKCTFFFTANIVGTNPLPTAGALGGWTETYYDPRDLTDVNALNSSIAALPRRLALLTNGWRCYLVRVSRFPFSRTAAKQQIDPQTGSGTYTTQAANTTDTPAYSVLVLNYTSATGKTRNSALRGVGQNVVGPNGLFLSPTQFVNNFGFFQNVWAGPNPYALRIVTNQTLQLVTAVLVAPIAGVPAATTKTPAVQTNGGVLAGPPYPSVRISGVVGMAGLNGLWSVQNSSQVNGVTTHQLAPKRRHDTQGLYQSGGTLVPYTVSLDPLVNVTPGQGGPHKLGRAPFAPRGRRSRRQS